MGRSKRKVRGTASLTFLLLLIISTGLLTILGSILWQQLAIQQRQLKARQWAQLFTSFCEIQGKQPVADKAEKKDLVTVQLSSRDEPVTFSRATSLSGQGLIRQEELTLMEKGGYSPMKAVRYGLVMPGKVAGSYPDGSIWDQAAGMQEVPVPWDVYSSLQKVGVMPDKARMEKTVAGYLYYRGQDELLLPGTSRLQGRGVFVCENRIRMGRNFRLKGDFRMVCRQDVEIGADVVLDKVFLFSNGSIKIGKNSQVKGILAARGSVKLEQGASVLEDRSVLEPFCTLYL